MAKEYEPIITSAAIILIIIFMPTGILGLVDKWLGHRVARKKPGLRTAKKKREGEALA
jgi:hypothetical protein